MCNISKMFHHICKFCVLRNSIHTWNIHKTYFTCIILICAYRVRVSEFGFYSSGF